MALVVVVSALAAAAPAIPSLRPGVAGIVLVELASVGLCRLALLTRTAPVGRGPAVAAIAGDEVDERPVDPRRPVEWAGAVVGLGAEPGAEPDPRPDEGLAPSLARRAGRSFAGLERVARSAAGGARRAAPVVDAGLGAAARAAGRTAGRRGTGRAPDGGSTRGLGTWKSAVSRAPTSAEPEPPGATRA